MATLTQPLIEEQDLPSNLLPRRARRTRIIVLGIGLLVLFLIVGVGLVATMGFTCG